MWNKIYFIKTVFGSKWSEVWKGWILFVTKSSLLFRWLWPYCDQNKLISDILSYSLRFKRKPKKIWTNFEEDVDKSWGKPTLNFDIFTIGHAEAVWGQKRLIYTLCQNQMGYREMSIFYWMNLPHRKEEFWSKVQIQ